MKRSTQDILMFTWTQHRHIAYSKDVGNEGVACNTISLHLRELKLAGKFSAGSA